MAVDGLLRQIREKEEEMWILYVALQDLKIKDSELFQKQNFTRLRETCKHILNLIGGVATSKL